jgi:membrane dipeptidase
MVKMKEDSSARTKHGRNRSPGFYYAIVDATLKSGFTADEIAKVGSGNFCRVFDASTARHQKH